MNARRRTALRLLALLAACCSAAVLLLLLEIRPSSPSLPRSLSSPVTLGLVRSLLDVGAWGGAVLLAGLLLLTSVRRLATVRPRAQRPLKSLAVRAARVRPLAQIRLARGSADPGFAPPFRLVPRPRSERGPEPRHAIALAFAPARPGAVAVAAQAAPIEEPVVAPAPPPRSVLPPPSIALLGPLEIAPLKRRRRGLRSQTQEFLACLALHPQGATSEEIIAALWPETDEEKARQQLWRAISDARSQLGDVILRSNDRYQLDREAVAVDLDRFEQLLAQADQEPAGERRQLLERALTLVRGQPLAGSDYPWAAGDLRRLRASVVDCLQVLGHHRLDDGNAAGALAAAEQAIALDQYNEAAHRIAIQSEFALGLRQAIADRYERLRRDLDIHFGLEPERETRLLYRRLLSQDPDVAERVQNELDQPEMPSPANPKAHRT